MTEQDLLDELSGKYHKIGTPYNAETSPQGLAIRSAESITWLCVPVYDVLDNTMERKNIFIYVEDRGLETESAYYQGTVPESRTELKVKANELAAQTEIKAG